ncbi:MAG: N-6 DNA methylase [Balneola sp.]
MKSVKDKYLHHNLHIREIRDMLPDPALVDFPNSQKKAELIVQNILDGYRNKKKGQNTSVVCAEIGKKIQELPFDLATYVISSFYTKYLPGEYRSDMGIFYTPPTLVHRVLDVIESRKTKPWTRLTIIDPSCGGGAFLVPIVQRIIETEHPQPEELQEFISNNLRGIEKDHFGSQLTEQFLQLLLENHFPGYSFDLTGVVACQDSLKTSSKLYDSFDLVIGNPPYGRVKLSDRERNKWAESIYGHANFYGLFAHLGIKLLKKDGMMAYVMPASFLGGRYFKKLRLLFLKECPPIAADFIKQRDGIFPDVLQEVSLMYYKKYACPRPRIDVNFLEAREIDDLRITPGGRYLIATTDDSPWIIPRNLDQLSALSRLDRLATRLADLGYKVSTGPLVWNRHKAQLTSKRTKNNTVIIWAESLSPKVNGSFNWRSEGRNHLPYYKPHNPEDPNLIHKPCILLQRTTSIEQKRRLVWGIMDNDFISKYPLGVAVENHLNMIIPMKGQTPLIPLRTIAFILNQPIIDKIFRSINGSTAVSAFELSAIPLPDLKKLIAIDQLLNQQKYGEAESAFQSVYL